MSKKKQQPQYSDFKSRIIFFKFHSFMRMNEVSPNYFGILAATDFIFCFLSYGKHSLRWFENSRMLKFFLLTLLFRFFFYVATLSILMSGQPIYEAILPNWQERRLSSANSVIVRLCFCVQLTAEFSLHESCRYSERNGRVV
jgi:hypothetical protein